MRGKVGVTEEGGERVGDGFGFGSFWSHELYFTPKFRSGAGWDDVSSTDISLRFRRRLNVGWTDRLDPDQCRRGSEPKE